MQLRCGEIEADNLYSFPSDFIKYTSFTLAIPNCRKLSETKTVLLQQLRKILSIVDLVTVLPLPGNDILNEMNMIAREMPDKGVFFTGSLLTEDSFLKASFEKSEELLLVLKNTIVFLVSIY